MLPKDGTLVQFQERIMNINRVRTARWLQTFAQIIEVDCPLPHKTTKTTTDSGCKPIKRRQKEVRHD